MHYTSDHKEMPLNNQISKALGKYEGNASRTTKTHSPNNKDLDKPHSILLQPQGLGTTNQFLWTLTKQEPQEGTGEGMVKDNPEGMWPGQMMSEPREGYRVHVSTVANKDISLMIAP